VKRKSETAKCLRPAGPTRWSWTGGGIGSWRLPAFTALRDILGGRHLAFVGDSLAQQEFEAAVSLLQCQGLRLVWSGRRAYFPELDVNLSRIVAQLGVQPKTMPQDQASNLSNWYINPQGVKTKIKATKAFRYLVLEEMKAHEEIVALSDQGNCTFVMNFGHWIRDHRGDVFFKRDNKTLKYSEAARRQVYHDVAKFMAEWFERNLKEDSHVIWHGFSANSYHPKSCDRMSAWSQAQWAGLREGSGKGAGQERETQFLSASTASRPQHQRMDGTTAHTSGYLARPIMRCCL